MTMIRLDGRMGEGGGQVLRTALGLSVATGRPFEIEAIRGGRRKPGLLRQHLTCVRAAARLGGAVVEGAEIGSGRLRFEPSGLYPGVFDFAIGSAGSTTLVLQAVLPALLMADGPSQLTVEGGTHNRAAPPFEFLAEVFGPVLNGMGVGLDVTLDRPGFEPAGGGRIVARTTGGGSAAAFHLVAPPSGIELTAEAMISALPRNVATRELFVLQNRLGLKAGQRTTTVIENPRGPGNVVLLRARWAGGSELFVGFGRRGVPAEEVAAGVADAYEAWAAAGVPVGSHLADQLLIPMALAGGGRFRTTPPSLHTRTNIEVIERFLPVRFEVMPDDDRAAVEIFVAPR